jgi:hypothetical protein
MSPVEMAGMLNFSASLAAYVPLPAPGGPKIMSFVLGSSFLFFSVVFGPS